MPSIAQRYEAKPHKWNLSIVLAVGAILWSGLIMTVNIHSRSDTAHPAITQQLDRVEANQIRAQAIAMAKLVCDEPSNQVYKNELSRLIIQWEGLTGQTFPRELTRCS